MLSILRLTAIRGEGVGWLGEKGEGIKQNPPPDLTDRQQYGDYQREREAGGGTRE